MALTPEMPSLDNLNEMTGNPIDTQISSSDALRKHGNPSVRNSPSSISLHSDEKPSRDKAIPARRGEDDDQGILGLNEVVADPGDQQIEHDLYAEEPLEEARDSIEQQESVARKEEDAVTPHDAEKTPNKLWTHSIIYSYLVLFSIFGVLARLGLQALNIYPNTPLAFTEIWANVVGSFFIGYLSEDRSLVRQDWHALLVKANMEARQKDHAQGVDDEAGTDLAKAFQEFHQSKKDIPLYVGLSVGFCGSLTSFSSWMRDNFLALANRQPTLTYPGPGSTVFDTYTRDDGYSVLATVSVAFIELVLPFCAMVGGAHLAIFLEHLVLKIPATPKGWNGYMDTLIVFLSNGCWLGAIIMTIWTPDQHHGAQETWRGKVLFAITFAPVGCLLRFFISIKLNTLSAAFPVGTFAVNMLGTTILAIIWDMQRLRSVNAGWILCQVFQGIEDGFCGALTTVSTLMLELKSLRTKHAYQYCLITLLSGLMIVVTIMGSAVWGTRLQEPVCL